MFLDEETMDVIVHEGIQRLVAKWSGQIECDRHHGLDDMAPDAEANVAFGRHPCPSCRAVT